MPNIKSAKKRVKVSARQHDENQVVRSMIKTARRKYFESADEGDKEKSKLLYREFCSVVDKAVKKGTIKKTAADRRKSRATLRLNKMA